MSLNQNYFESISCQSAAFSFTIAGRQRTETGSAAFLKFVILNLLLFKIEQIYFEIGQILFESISCQHFVLQ